MTLTLRPKYAFKVPIEADCITPNTFAEKTVKEIGALKVWEGNRQQNLDELFYIEGEGGTKPAETGIQIIGDVHKVRRVGAGMSAGEIMVEGDAGIHLGEEMTGGRIAVAGNADSWSGSMMRGGVIEVKGDAGDYVGASYRGSKKGMRGGVILIHGNAGNELGCFMRKGLIKVQGNVGQFVGMHMKNGAILVQGSCEGRAGAEMSGGKIAICGIVPSILPAFTIDSVKAKVKIDGEEVAGPFYLFVGDQTENGIGKLYVAQAANRHLKFYEEYL